MAISIEKEFKIIIATEKIIYRNNLASALRMQNFTVEFCEGGFHLLNLLEQSDNNISLVIVHENMQDMPAQEIISLTRTHKNKNELPIIFISQKNQTEEISDIISSGANEYIVQGSNLQSILEKTKKYYKIFSNFIS
ncbi:MAG: response regulator [Bacteriovorax sp.]|nr:response regulator [Bacteriovorax sp.]